MTHLTGAERATYVQNMFARIAGKYDLMNRLMTGGQDIRWRKILLSVAAVPRGGSLLDLGTGTGDIAAQALQNDPTLTSVGGDFTLEMMRVGKADSSRQTVRFTGTDALNLPFPDNTFDAVTSGYLMRNVIDVRRAWAEQYRVLKPGGRVVCLDTTPPPKNLLWPFINFHLHVVIPVLGRLIAGASASDAYTYLPDSTENFLPAEKLAERMAEAGFKDVSFQRLMFGTMAIHWGTKGSTD
ncbi:MAG: ubiquinone/menaquinone biosynthesis methyltransferase [Chloroflexi bacterium]|nr:ubiquinone/menaquinone biosynthesis methyltransferase [Chloroflexota bacterium]